MNKGKYLAIDFGDRRVGLAISDFDKQIAFPRDFLEYSDSEELIDRIKAFCADEQIIKVVVGLPVEMDGTMGERATKTYEFGDRLKKAIYPISVDYFDERLTTKEATKKLHQQGFKEREQKGQKDMVSAQIILEAYLKTFNL